MERALRFSMTTKRKKTQSRKKELCRGARVTYMQFILTKGASLSHCAERRDRLWRDRRQDLNILLRDSRRDNSDGDESRLGRKEGRERERRGKECESTEKEWVMERGCIEGDIPIIRPLASLCPSIQKNTAEFLILGATFAADGIMLPFDIDIVRAEQRRPERRMQIGLPVSRR